MDHFIVGKMHFRIARHSLRSTFDQVVDMSDEVERMIALRVNALEAKADEYRKIEDEECREHRMESLYEDFVVYDREWPHLMRRSQMLSICSYFEHQLVVFADRFAKVTESKFQVRDLRDRGIRACRKLMIKCGLEEDVFKQSRWDELIDLYQFRNRIAHAGGDFDKDTRKLLPKYTKLFIPPEGHDISYAKDQILLRKNAIREICELMYEVFNAVGTACSEHCKT